MPRFKPTGTLKADRAVSRRRWLAAFIIIAVLIAAGKVYGLVTHRESPVDALLIRVTSPVVMVVRLIGDGITYTVEVVTHFPTLLREKNQLKTENEYLNRKLEELRNVRAENEQLRQLLALESPQDFRPINATVIARPYDLWVESIIINAGSDFGVESGNLAVNELGLVGKVTEVHPGYSVVQLSSSPQCRIWSIAGESRAEGMVVGTGGPYLSMELIEAGSELALGEKVFTRGRQPAESTGELDDELNVSQPRGVFIGTVVSREVDRNGFLKVTVEPASGSSRIGNLAVMVR